jgi:PPOX class probable F420-dependent enzyme
MGSTRERIRMTAEEIAAFLDEPHKLQLATINPDGTPHLVTMYYAPFGDQIGFWTYRSSQKAANLRRDPRATCLVEAGEGYEELRGVQISGTVRILDAPDEVLPIGAAVYGRHVRGLGDGLDAFLADQARKRSAYLLTPSRISSWDHRKLAVAATS